MAEKMEDLNLPQSAVLKIIKEAIPAHANIGKDVKAALAKAASIFILYLTAQSTQSMQNAKRKTITSQDIFDALEELEFGHFIKPLQDCLKEQAETKAKKGDKAKTKQPDAEEEEAEDEDDAEGDDVDEK